MIVLAATTDKIQLITSSAATLDVHASHIDCSAASPPVVDQPERTNTAISSAATTDIVAAPGASKRRMVKTLHIRNKHASLSCDVTVQFNQNATLYELHKVTLAPGETLEYIEGIGFFEIAASTGPLPQGNANSADQTANAADTYLLGSTFNLNPSTGTRIKVGTTFRWWISATKTAAGIATPIWQVRFGTAGTTADSNRLTFTGLAQTGVADTAMFVIVMNVRTLGATGVVEGSYGVAAHRLAATGFINQAIDAAEANSGAFDLTVSNLLVGVSVNPGASGVWTIKTVSLDVTNTTNQG
jgi:plastocyanin